MAVSELHYSDEYLWRILCETQRIAGVGMSPKVIRPSWFVGNYMHKKGIGVIAINPNMAGEMHFGTRAVASLADIPEAFGSVEMVDIFRRSEQVLPAVEEAIDILVPRGLKFVWMQIGVINHEAAKLAESFGLSVVMNRCPKMEYQRLSGELRFAGINTGIISSRM